MTQSRQLAAIMFTDIVGYTALMGNNEQKAFEILKKNRDLQKPVIEKFNGRWIKELGDGVMASFNTVSDAVGAAILIQENCNAAKDFQLRIGIHLGEVVFENDDVFGDGVNIAARIQAVANPGCIYVSESVHHNVSNKIDITTKFIKEEKLKNVKEPVKIYEAIRTGDIKVASDSEMPQASRRKNSIAVLPFANMSSDPEQEYFSDGLTEEIISDLSKINTLLVISRSSIMTLKGTLKKVKEIAEELNVGYVLEGSVRKAGNNLRITSQLIDASNESNVWSEKYNGTLDDIFDIQEKVSRSIVGALKLKLTPAEVTLISERPINNLQAYDCYLRARHEIFRGTHDSIMNAFKLLQNGIELIGPNELLYGLLGYGHIFYFRYVDKLDQSNFDKAGEYATKAFELNPRSVLGYVINGWIHWTKGRLQESADSMKHALKIEPDNIDALFGLSETYLYAGKSAETYYLAEKISALDPLSPMSYITQGSFLIDIKIEEGLPFFEKAYHMDPSSPLTQWMLGSAYFWSGKNEAAYPLVDMLAKNVPDWAFTRQMTFLKYGVLGNKEKALELATKQLDEEAVNDRHFAFHLAECYAVIDEKEKALGLLEYSMELFFPYRFLSSNPLFKNLFGEEQFKNLMKWGKKKSDAFEI
jgi:adenylate cyclase